MALKKFKFGPKTALRNAQLNNNQARLDAFKGYTGVETARLADQLNITFQEAVARKDAAAAEEQILRERGGRDYSKVLDRSIAKARVRSGSKTQTSPLITQAKANTVLSKKKNVTATLNNNFVNKGGAVQKKVTVATKKEISKPRGTIGPKNKRPLDELPFTALDKVRGFTVPNKNRQSESSAQRALKGGGAFAIGFVEDVLKVWKGVSTAKRNDVYTQTVIKQAFSKEAINAVGTELGRAASSSDPYDKTQTILGIVSTKGFNPSKVKPVFGSIKKQTNKIKVFNEDRLTKVKNEIKKLESGGINVRQKNAAADKLRALINQQRIYEESVNLTSPVLKQVETIIVSNVTKPKVRKLKVAVDKARPKLRANKVKVDRIEKQIKSLDKTRISKELTKFNQRNKLQSVKVQKVLSKDKNVLVKQLIEARKKGGKEFAALKKKIQKELRLNPVQRMKKGKVTFVLLEPKLNKKKGVKTATQKEKIINLNNGTVSSKRKKGKTIEVKKELTAKEKRRLEKQLEFENGQNLDKVMRDLRSIEKHRDFFNGNKKAQSTFAQSVKRVVKKTSDSVKRANQIKNEFRARHRKPIKKQKEFIENKRKVKEKLKKERKRVSEQKKKLTEAQNIAKGIKLRAGTLNILGKAIIQATKQEKALDGIIKQVEDLTPVKPKPNTGGGNGKGGTPSRPPSKPTPKNRTPKTPPVRKQGNPKKPPTSPPSKPPKKPRIPKLIPKPTNTKTTKGKLGAIQYVTGKGKKRKVVTVKTGLTYNRAISAAKKAVDNTTKASFTVKPYGKTKKKDSANTGSLKKFTTKKGKDPTVRKVVEKKKYRIDTSGEKKGLKFSKALQKEIKKAKSKKASKKKKK